MSIIGCLPSPSLTTHDAMRGRRFVDLSLMWVISAIGADDCSSGGRGGRTEVGGWMNRLLEKDVKMRVGAEITTQINERDVTRDGSRGRGQRPPNVGHAPNFRDFFGEEILTFVLLNTNDGG